MRERQPERSWHVPRETSQRLAQLCDLIRHESAHQNLVSAATLPQIENRHVEDSWQLMSHVPPDARSLLDIGSGGGFPGLVLAIALPLDVTLVEPRPLRAAFLRNASASLGLENAAVVGGRVERVTGHFDVITARAVASLEKLFAMAEHLAGEDTVWVLPKGRSVHVELAAARGTWQGRFHVEPSVTDPEAGIVIARNVRRKQPA